MPLSEYKIFMEALNYYNESYDLAFEDAMADKLKDLLGADYYNNVYIPFKNKIASKVKVGEDEDGNPIMGENPDLKLKQPKYLLDTYSDNPQALKDLIDNYKTKSDEIKEAKKGSKYLGENDEYKCYRITKYPAAQYYGSNTTWCITGRYEGEESRGEYYFNKYIRDERLDGGYYFFLHKTNPRRKYALLQQVDKKDKEHPLKIHSVWNAQDEDITNRDEFYNLNLPKIKEIPDLDTDLIKISGGILQACKNEDIDKLKELLDQLSEMGGADVNIEDADGNTPLYWACNNDNIELVKLLIEHGADVDSKNKNEKSPLYFACKKGNITIVKLLLEHGANVNSKDTYGTTPLLLACYHNNIDLVKLLLEHGANVSSKNRLGVTPLEIACRNNNIDLVNLLLEHGADVNVKNKDGNILLYLACKYNNTELAKLLLEHGAGKDLDVNDLPYYIIDNEEIAELVTSYLNKNKRTEAIKIRRLYRL